MPLQTMEMAGMEVTAPAMGTVVMAAMLEPVLMETVETAAMAVRMVETAAMAAMATAPVTVEMAATRDLAD
ncbi:hypothetical protein K6R05_21510 (plasmid) [Pantoea alfalfae]|uniref:hypothetical protein n=1 Tax=Pantoea alfalfae TaxID=3074822 RepID=UPI001CA3E4C3|nr:hypothetical protein [Pantoea alfalfae]QZX98151.1 hypothetical protein K6R05_21510 [Pantoea alfalfae]